VSARVLPFALGVDATEINDAFERVREAQERIDMETASRLAARAQARLASEELDRRAAQHRVWGRRFAVGHCAVLAWLACVAAWGFLGLIGGGLSIAGGIAFAGLLWSLDRRS
jgi:hypothetical protein